uniref:Uncharacterized protein n=1 Tax=Strigops habroptila TaxID=2489341 RepID=A0A672UG85_STRHB
LLGHSPFAADSYFLFSTYIMLVFDSVLYMLLAMYFDKVLPGKYGIPDPPFFCLKPSYWVRSRRGSTREMPRASVSPEEQELNNIKKAYKKKDKKTEALRGKKAVILLPVKNEGKQLCKHFSQRKHLHCLEIYVKY